MEQIFRVILSLSISGGLVGLLILLFRPMTKRLFAKRWTYYLWILLLVRLLVPIHTDINLMGQLSAMLGEIGSPQRSVDEASAVGYVEGAEAESPQASVKETSEYGYAGNAETGNVSGMESAGNADDGVRRVNIFQVAGIIWILGVFLTVVYRVYIYRKFVKGIYAGCMPVTDRRILNKSAEIQARLGIIKEVLIYENAAINVPMLIGFRKPYIVLPSKLLAEMVGRENDICLILHHELIHYKRRDIWYKWLFQTVLCVHWFNPLLYLFNRKFNVDCELSCDEVVMALLSEDGRRIYGNVLLDVAEKNLSEGTFVMHRSVPTMTLLEEKETLKERLQGIAKYQKKGFIIGFCSALVLMLFVAVAVMCGVAGVHVDSGNMFAMRNASPGIVDRVLNSITDASFFEEPMLVNKNGKPYRMYDDDELIAGESEHDTWRAWNYYGGEMSTNVGKFVLNGSDVVRIMYANKETTLEISSAFNLCEGRFKVVWINPDQTVQTLNESGEENSVKITLAQGRNVFKMVGQKARVEDVSITLGEMVKEDFDGIYFDEDTEYAYLVLEGKKPIDVSGLEEVCPYLKAEEVSKLFQKAWEDGAVLSEENWQDLFIYSDVKVTTQYLLEELEAGRVGEFDSRKLVEIAPYMKAKDVSECFRCLLERGKVSESDLEDIFVYSDADLAARYLIEALKKGETNEFSGKIFDQVGFQLSSEELTDIVLALGKDDLTFHDLQEHVIPFLKEEQNMQCIFHYIDLGNVLTDSQLGEVQPFVSEKNFYRIIEYNGKRK